MNKEQREDLGSVHITAGQLDEARVTALDCIPPASHPHLPQPQLLSGGASSAFFPLSSCSAQ